MSAGVWRYLGTTIQEVPHLSFCRLSQKSIIMKKIFTPNGGKPIVVSSLEDIIDYMRDHLDGFSGVETHENYVLAYIDRDPTPICIGTIK